MESVVIFIGNVFTIVGYVGLMFAALCIPFVALYAIYRLFKGNKLSESLPFPLNQYIH